jgi:hypothetical protein
MNNNQQLEDYEECSANQHSDENACATCFSLTQDGGHSGLCLYSTVSGSCQACPSIGSGDDGVSASRREPPKDTLQTGARRAQSESRDSSSSEGVAGTMLYSPALVALVACMLCDCDAHSSLRLIQQMKTQVFARLL